jgi:putative phosphoribosyl transferase
LRFRSVAGHVTSLVPLLLSPSSAAARSHRAEGPGHPSPNAPVGPGHGRQDHRRGTSGPDRRVAFRQVSGEEVAVLLDRAVRAERAATGADQVDLEVEVPAGAVRLPGRFTVPPGAQGLVVCAHGSGSRRHSPRNRYVAGVLQQAGLGTLLVDLLQPAEEEDRGAVFDIGLLAGRLLHALGWLRLQPASAPLRLGLFGASTGAAAALWAAAEPAAGVAAIVSRGGRPDLAAARLSRVTAPTLLIVGGHDEAVLRANRAAASTMRCAHRVEVVPGATHLFWEPGALAAAAALARGWFVAHLGGSAG